MTAEMREDRLTIGTGGEAREIASLVRPGTAPGLFWLGGFKSDMAGTKALALDAHAAERGLAMSRFDYSGHGISGGRFEDGTISRWLEEALAVFDRTTGRQILIGSSMGGWIALLLGEAHRLAAGAGKSRIGGIVLIAPAVDMTRALIWAEMDEAARETLMKEGRWLRPSDYSGEPYIIQGLRDTDVPWRHATALVSRFASDDVVLTLIKDGDHRLSRPEDIERLIAAVDGLVSEAG
jgi:pimeloyl-ACP methyl ester carboxylesterase